MTLQRTKNIKVSGAGYQALEARSAKSAATQINIINSTVGQVALREVNNIEVFVIPQGRRAGARKIDALPRPKRARGAAGDGVIIPLSDIIPGAVCPWRGVHGVSCRL